MHRTTAANTVLGIGVIALADGIKNSGALVSVNLLNNLIGAEQAQNFVAILKEHRTLKSLCGNKGDETELDMSGKNMCAEDAIMLAPEITTNGALAKLIFGGDTYYDYGERNEVAEPAVLEVGMTEADLSNKNLGPDGAVIVGAWLSHKDNGALTSLNISTNKLTRGKWTNALGNNDRNDESNYEKGLSGL